MVRGSGDGATPTSDEDACPITVTRTVTRAAGTNRYDVTLTVKNTTADTIEDVVVYDYLNDLQFVGDMVSKGITVSSYQVPQAGLRNDYRIRLEFDVGDVIPHGSKLLTYKAVPIIDGVPVYYECKYHVPMIGERSI